ncbi:2'-5' RNA ligase family protein [Streptomyces rimosus]|uniref:2'-5' RNA ligase family protein n=1 Tax=Streptomyces rimosus TaxID=1927 RepID=UPI0031E347A3
MKAITESSSWTTLASARPFTIAQKAHPSSVTARPLRPRETPVDAIMAQMYADEAHEGAGEDAPPGWPDIPGDTAFTIKVPEADPLVRAGFPAHVTVLYPFVHESRIDAATDRELTTLFAGHDAFTLTFDSFRRYPGVLYLDPWPHDPVTALTKDLTRRWPEAVPYRGIFGAGLDPHLTVANSEGPATQDAAYDALQAELEPRLPLSCRVQAVNLIVWDGARWRDRATYRLRACQGPC